MLRVLLQEPAVRALPDAAPNAGARVGLLLHRKKGELQELQEMGQEVHLARRLQPPTRWHVVPHACCAHAKPGTARPHAESGTARPHACWRHAMRRQGLLLLQRRRLCVLPAGLDQVRGQAGLLDALEVVQLGGGWGQ